MKTIKIFSLMLALLTVAITVSFGEMSISAAEAPNKSAVHSTAFKKADDGKVGDKLNVRFIASVDGTDHTSVGFKVTAPKHGKSWDNETSVVYSKITASAETGVTSEYTADSGFLYALTIKGVPTVGTVVFNVTPYSTKGGQTDKGDTYIITYTNGVLSSIKKDTTVILPPDVVS